MPKSSFYGLAWLLFLLAACGGGGPNPPQVVAFYPQDGYHGFRKNEVIRIAFDRPMDRAATEAAFELLDESDRPVAVRFTWEDEGRRLVIAPASPLDYSRNSDYLHYRYRLSTGARGVRGQAIERPLEVRFTTLRTLTAKRSSVAAADGAVSSLGLVYNDPNDPSAYPTAMTGDTAGNHGLRSFFAFDLRGLGLTADDVAYARLDLYNTALQGAPFGTGGLGTLILETVDYLGDGQLDAGDYNATAGRKLATIPSWAANVHLSLEIGEGLKDALDSGKTALELRLRFTTETDGDHALDTVAPATGEDPDDPPRLRIGYYAP